METRKIPMGIRDVLNQPNIVSRMSHQKRHENLCEKLLKDEKALEQWNIGLAKARAKER
jgi:hypothetical protein